MKTYPTIWLLTFISCLIPMLIVNIIYAFIIGNCDPKFGCWGGVQLSAFILGICSFLSAFSVTGAYLINKKIKYIAGVKFIIPSTLVIGVILSVSTSFLVSSPLGSTLNMVLVWLVVSFIVASIVYLANGLLFE